MRHQAFGRGSRRRAWLSGAVVLGAGLGLFACQGLTPPDGCLGCGGDAAAEPNLRGLLVSGPLPGPGTLGGRPVTWVALGLGTVPGGFTAAVRSNSGAWTQAAVINGGFDPTPLAAAEGDSVFVKVLDRLGRPVDSLQAEIRRRPPVIVRTEPPPRKRDVPLNASLLVVFSEPVDPSTVTDLTIRLFNGTFRVPGTVQLAPDGMRAEFRPSTQLRPGTDYTLDIGTGLRGLGGDPLEAPLQVTFTTGSQPSGFIRIVTTTTGLSLSPSGYRAIVDADTAGAPVIFAPDTLLLAAREGDHSITLTTPVPSCVVLNPNWSGAVAAAATTTVVFRISCASGPRTGMNVEVNTTGTGLPEDYVLIVRSAPIASGSWEMRQMIPVNAQIPVDVPAAGGYSVQLWGVPPDCGGEILKVVRVVTDQIASVRFDLACTAVTQLQSGAPE